MVSQKLSTRALAMLLSLVFILPLLFGCSQEQTEDFSDGKIDYSKEENWAYFAEGEDKAADLFIICPTVDMGKNGNLNMSLEDEKNRSNFVGALNMQRGIYEDSAVMYAPFYRQMTFPACYMTEEEVQPYFDIAYADVCHAFEYYMQNINQGRPLILAGFSQGSQLLLELLADYFDNPEYSERLIAAYCIGWIVTDEYLAKNPHVKMAQGEKDTGVVISFNSEAVEVWESLSVKKGQKSNEINPLNWKTDSTPADSTLNKGACFTNYDGEIVEEIPSFCGGYIDEQRGTLKLPDVNSEEYSSSITGEGVYHLYDYQFFFRNLQENVKKRTENFLADRK